MARYTNNPAISLALDANEEKAAIGLLASKVVDLLLYIVDWVKSTVKGALFMVPNANSESNGDIDKIINEGEEPTQKEFVENIGQYLENRQLLERFFKGKEDFIQNFARKIVSLEEGSASDLGDDSTSMKREGRWESQKELIQRITQVTTLVLPDGEGVALRFINRDVDNATNLTLEGIRDILQPMTWQPGGDTPIGTNLRSKILQPLVYDKITKGTLERPVLIIIITDGMPEPEDSSVLVNAILECERQLQENAYPPQKRLDEKFSEYKANEKNVDQWLIETLFSPFQNY
ncbi:hypothetical protein ACHAO4_006271 [Trichoderma viride]